MQHFDGFGVRGGRAEGGVQRQQLVGMSIFIFLSGAPHCGEKAHLGGGRAYPCDIVGEIQEVPMSGHPKVWEKAMIFVFVSRLWK